MATILIADDDKNIARALCVRLRSDGYETLTAHDGVSAVQKAVQENPDLILLDISMPAGNGLFVAEQLKSMDTTRDTPIIFMTAKSNPEYFDQAMEREAIAFLAKPFDDAALLPLVYTTLDAEPQV
ncbi:MAG: response regulator [Planctomycetota bacterium]